MSANVTLRPAERADIPTLTRVTNDANARSVLHKRMSPWQDEYPLGYYNWRLRIIRQRFVTPDLRNFVAEDSSTGEILGMASWAVEGSETALHKQWHKESDTWANWIELKMITAEKSWGRYFTDRCVDYRFMDSFMSAFMGKEHLPRPPCIHCHLVVVKPDIQSKGVGRMLIDWAKDLAVKEGLPIFLEATLEATGFYDKIGFSRLSTDVTCKPVGGEPLTIPLYVWEGEQREGRWLERDESFQGDGQRWRWRDDVLPKEVA